MRATAREGVTVEADDIAAHQWEVLKQALKWKGSERGFLMCLNKRIKEFKDERARGTDPPPAGPEQEQPERAA
jgi:hypothetical protein